MLIIAYFCFIHFDKHRYHSQGKFWEIVIKFRIVFDEKLVMTDDIKKYFNGLIQKWVWVLWINIIYWLRDIECILYGLFFFFCRVSGILSIIVTDRDGTPVISAKAEDAPLEIGLATKPNILSTYTNATDQASKLGLGKNQSIVCMYSNYQVHLPLKIQNWNWLMTFFQLFFFLA